MIRDCFVDRCLSFLYFFFWSLCCLFFFDLQILITPLVSSNSSCNANCFHEKKFIRFIFKYLQVGLRSDMIHSAFNLIPGGVLDLVRRCEAMSCDGHCACAPQDQKCQYSVTLGNCTNVSAGRFACLMVFNATFNNISVISWWSVLLVEETGGPRENHRPVASHWQTLSYKVVHLALIWDSNSQHQCLHR
jgi:hypothetical protein